ncbi:unnamed protein product [Rhizophagus irregularis]|uniref:Uncharacterized protein n=1 Tax=Rhizophagus irregularis TaxID=588596 RepID=A0A2N1MH48_9GLOM|nr:hypothetical protein RhiirC2_792545 [Rhizophagus irregularis]CAB4393581.1 unnamed protein product [Rhizophagus irregularis]CAB5362467.1 unnamed protein product [Rhizophagus irregularis]
MNSNIINFIPNKCTMCNHSTENNFTININNDPMTSESEKTFEFYLALPNDTIIYVTYTKLSQIEIAQHLNNKINLSHIPNNQFSHHYYVQNLIQRQIIQKSQQNCNFYNCIQEDMGPYRT